MAKILKFIQVNIYKGRYLDALCEFLNGEKPDIVAMQEVAFGDLSLYSDKSVNLFEYIKEKTGMDGYFLDVQKFTDSADSKFGNAVLTRFPILDVKVLTLKEFRSVTVAEFNNSKIWPYVNRAALDVILDIGGIRLHAISWHGAWTAPPQDTPQTLRQAKIVADYLKLLDEPFIAGVDINNVLGNQTVNLINQVANNLMTNLNVKQTTHPKIHKIVPRGYLVDFIFCSDDFKKISVEVPDVTISDHLPVVAKLELL